MQRRDRTRLLTGAVLTVVGLSAAWTVGRPPAEVEPAPAEHILEMEAERADAVTWDLPVTRNDRVDTWIDFLKGRNAHNTEKWMEREGRYGPMIRAELRRRGMPQDLLYLAMIESGLSPKAYSKAAASGMWQFIAETGQRYGLEVSSEVDERRDPVKATSSALDYLGDLYDRFGSWYLAAAAYNTGENRVGRIMREEFGTERGTDDHFWMIAHRLPRETRDYVPLMLAMGHIAKEPESYGFEPIEPMAPLSYDVVWVPGSTDIELIAKAAGVPAADVEELNTHLVKGRTPADRGWSVRIPAGTRVAFEGAFPTLYRTALAEAAARPAPKAVAVAAGTHRVKRGETLSHIAKRYDVSVSALRRANGNIDPRRVRVGQTVKVPGAATAVASADTRYHRVRSGENLTVIAKRYGVSIGQLRSWNGINGSRIRAGQRLQVGA